MNKIIKRKNNEIKGIYKPTIEDIIEISNIEALHPGGMAFTKRVAEQSKIKPVMKVLDVLTSYYN